MARAFPLLLLLVFAATPCARADEGPPPPITRETLVDTWEAAPSWANAVYRLEINASGPSYLAFNLGGQNLVWRLTSSEVHNGKVGLHFHCISKRWKIGGGPEMDELEISGKGNSSDVRGTFEGALKMTFRPSDPVESTPLSFSKPAWVEFAAKQTKECEALIRDAKSRDSE
ncbi:MAG TPA: hypothetical protein VJ420_12895 [Candidatus Udaeobacter sp.]|nr:hypothetical protein [Candidatus Udaeobacter sp.]